MVGKTANNELKNQDPIQEQKNEQMSWIRKLRANTVKLGADLAEAREHLGKDKTNKDGSPVINEFGEVEKWPSKYYASFLFMGGEIETEVTPAQYEILIENIGMPFYLEGRMKKIKIFANGTPVEVIAPVFRTMELIA